MYVPSTNEKNPVRPHISLRETEISQMRKDGLTFVEIGKLKEITKSRVRPNLPASSKKN